jgi:hypothetical protein
MVRTRIGHGQVMVWSETGHGQVTDRSWSGHSLRTKVIVMPESGNGQVTVGSRSGHSYVTVLLRSCNGAVAVISRPHAGTVTGQFVASNSMLYRMWTYQWQTL